MPILGSFAVPHPPIIMPEIGRGEERKIQKTADSYREVARHAAMLKPDVFVLLSPHSIIYRDYFHISPGHSASGDFRSFGCPDLKIETEYDEELARTIGVEASSVGIPAGTLGERETSLDHATTIPLRYFQETCPRVPIVRIGLSGFSLLQHYNFGMAITRAVEKLNRHAVIIASGDLSHKLKPEGPYGFADEGPKFDAQIMEIFSSGDFGRLLEFDPTFCEAAAECGLRSFVIMAGALDGRSVACEALSHEDTFGVGYGVASFIPGESDERRHFGEMHLKKERARLDAIASREDTYVRLARLSLETYVKTRKYAELPTELPEELTGRRAGAFVTLKKDGELRGCIGTILPVTPSLANEILRNAVSAGTQDPRFPPVTAEELQWIVYDVDVLSQPEPAQYEDLDVKRYGVIVTSGKKCGLLLPDIDGVDTVGQQLSIALQKAGIRNGESFDVQRFEVVRHF